MSSAEFAIAAACTALPALAAGMLGVLPWTAIAASVAMAACCAAWLGAKCVRRIGGYTGDCLGAVQQVSEAAIYLCVLAR